MGKSEFAANSRLQPGQSQPKIDGAYEIEELRVVGDWAFTRDANLVAPAPILWK